MGPNTTAIRWPSKEAQRAFLIVAIKMTIIFTLVYGFCNWQGAQRTETTQFWMDWEMNIPLVPWMIIFYMSIYPMNFVPLFCFDEDEIHHLGNTMVAATFLAAVFFILFPAPIGFTRTTDVGIWSQSYKFLYFLDNTANTFPSLHIGYGFIMARCISSTRKVLAPIFWLWFLFITLSVLLTHQHHVLDILGGLALGEFCFHRFFIGGLRGIKFHC